MILKSQCIHHQLVFQSITSTILLDICVQFESYFTFKVICNTKSLDQMSSNVLYILKYVSVGVLFNKCMCVSDVCGGYVCMQVCI